MQSRQYATRPTEASSVTKTIYDEVEEMRKKISTLQIENDKLLKEVTSQFEEIRDLNQEVKIGTSNIQSEVI